MDLFTRAQQKKQFQVIIAESLNHHNGSRMQINLIFDLNDRIFIILRVKALSLTVAYTVRKYT